MASVVVVINQHLGRILASADADFRVVGETRRVLVHAGLRTLFIGDGAIDLPAGLVVGRESARWMRAMKAAQEWAAARERVRPTPTRAEWLEYAAALAVAPDAAARASTRAMFQNALAAPPPAVVADTAALRERLRATVRLDDLRVVDEVHVALARETGHLPALQDQLFRFADHVRELRACPDPEDRPIDRDHLAELKRSTIDADLARRAGLWTETDTAFVTAITGWLYEGSEWLVFPYRREPGGPAVRLRAKRTGQRAGYRQTANVSPGIYYPPGTLESGDLAHDDVRLVVVEGEKKALALDRMGYCAIGLPGVWCARDSSLPKGKDVLHPWIRADVTVKGREVIIAFDSNLQTKRLVRQAAERTAKMFTAAGGNVRLVQWPDDTRPWINGVDDLAYHEGDAAVRALIEGAVVVTPPAEILVPTMLLGELTPTAAIVLGAVLALEANELTAITDKVQAVVGGSEQALRTMLAKLSADGYLHTRRGQRTKDPEHGWQAEPNLYRTTLTDLQRKALLPVQRADLVFGDLPAIVIALVRHNGPLTLTEVAEAVSSSTKTISRAVRKARTEVEVVGETVRLRPGR